jgi:hypothetical protein
MPGERRESEEMSRERLPKCPTPERLTENRARAQSKLGLGTGMAVTGASIWVVLPRAPRIRRPVCVVELVAVDDVTNRREVAFPHRREPAHGRAVRPIEQDDRIARKPLGRTRDAGNILDRDEELGREDDGVARWGVRPSSEAQADDSRTPACFETGEMVLKRLCPGYWGEENDLHGLWI